MLPPGNSLQNAVHATKIQNDLPGSALLLLMNTLHITVVYCKIIRTEGIFVSNHIVF